MKWPRLTLLAAVSALVIPVIVGCSTTADRGAGQPDGGGATSPVGIAIKTPDPINRNTSLQDMVAHAHVTNPNIMAAEAKVRRLMARVPQEGSLPDPMLRVSAGSMAETAAGRVDWTAGVEQALPFPGKLREMAMAAGKDAEAAAAELESLRLNVAAQVRQAYWRYYLATRSTEITSENLNALGLVRESVDARVAANQGNQDDQLRLAAEMGKLEKVLIQSRQTEGSARSRLNALLDRPAGAVLPRPQFRAEASPRDIRALLASAEATHPEVRLAAAKLEAFRHRLNRAKLERYPDFMLGVQHAAVSNSGLAPSANGRDQIFATVGINLPLWQEPRRARIEEASAGIEEAAARMGAAQANLRHQVEDAWLRAKSAEDLIALFDRQILPEAQQAFESVLISYAAGNQSFVDALDAWRQLLAFQLQQAANQSQLGTAIADLRSATGHHF